MAQRCDVVRPGQLVSGRRGIAVHFSPCSICNLCLFVEIQADKEHKLLILT